MFKLREIQEYALVSWPKSYRNIQEYALAKKFNLCLPIPLHSNLFLFVGVL